jgi:hypothetical protein
VAALDGKATALPTLNHPLVQNHVEGQAVPFGLVRTVTCSLVSAAARPCIDAIPIPGDTNEVGHFQAAFASLRETYGSLFDLVTYDAGGFSRADADAVIAAGKDYLFALKDEHRAMCRLAEEMLAVEDVAARTEDALDNQTTAVRSPPAPTRGSELVLRRRQDAGGVGLAAREGVPRRRVREGPARRRRRAGRADVRLELRPRSAHAGAVAPRGPTPLGRREHNHHTLDTAFAEDDRPWIEADPHGMLAVLLLRRIAYTLLALFRAASRIDDGRAIRWRVLLTWVRDVLVAATEDQLAGLREVTARHTLKSPGSYPRRRHRRWDEKAVALGAGLCGSRSPRRPADQPVR